MPKQGTHYTLPPEEPRITHVDGAAITDTDDGGSIVDFGLNNQGREADPKNFKENLAEVLSETTLGDIGSYLIDAIEEDKESRQDWLSTLEKGIEIMGLKYEPLDWPWKNASGAWSPVLTEAWAQGVAEARAELLPVHGCVKSQILGTQTESLEDRADRVQDYMNYYFTQDAPEYYPETEQLFAWTIFEGSAFKKSYFDPLLNRPTSPLVRSKDLIVNFGATSIDTCERITQIFSLSYKELRARQLAGMYRRIKIDPLDSPEHDPVTVKIDAIDGIKAMDSDYSKSYPLYESHADLNLRSWGFKDPFVDDSGLPVPYLVVLDQDSHKILGFFRNWKKDHPQYKRKKVYTHFKYLPGFGFYGLGLMQVAGNSAYAATSCLRLTINAAVTSSFPGGVRMAGMRLQDNNIRVGPTEYKEIETGGLPVSQAFQPLPSKEPSPVLLELKNQFEESIKRISSITSTPLSEFNSNTPVGTMLAVIEQGQKVQSSVMARLHRSLGEEFQCIYDLFAEHMSDEEQQLKLAAKELHIRREDFSEDLRIIPVSDPNLSSATQRLMVAEGIAQLAANNPELYDQRAVQERILKEMKIQNIEEILPRKDDPEPLNTDALYENSQITGEQPVKVFKEQNHEAHIAVHQLIANPQMPNPVLDAHIRDHERYLYLTTIYTQMNKKVPDDINELPQEIQNQLDTMAGEAAKQHQQQMQQNQPPPPVDPGAALMADVQMKGQIAQSKQQAEAQQAQMEQQNNQMKLELERMKLEQESQQQMMKFQLEQTKLENQKQFEMMKLELQKQIELMKADRALHEDEIKGIYDRAKIETDLEKARMSHESKLEAPEGEIFPED